MSITSERKWHVPGSALTAILMVLWRLFVTAFSCVKQIWTNNNSVMRLKITVTLGLSSALYTESASFSVIARI